jgi:transcriptional regulator with XRE-family HTH domain
MPFLLPSYVRSHRKRWHLSQRELAFLLGLSSQAVISQHESLARLPQTKALLKYEVLFGEPIGELFPRLRAEAEGEVAEQVKALMARLEKRTDLPAARKLELLNKLIQRLDALPS